MDMEAELKTAETHAAAVVLMGLQTVERGWATLTAHDPLIEHGLTVVHSEGEARGIAKEDITTTPISLHQRVQELGAQGVDPHVVATETKSEAKAKEEADLSNKDPEERKEAGETLPEEPAAAATHVSNTAHTPAPPGAVVDEPGAISATSTGEGVVPGTDTAHSPTGTGQPTPDPVQLPPGGPAA